MIGQHLQSRLAVLVTGATGGIGAAFADLFARRGRALVLVALNAGRLEAKKKEIVSRHGVPVHTIAADLSDPWVVEEIVEDLRRRSLAIDVLVNSAGFNECGLFTETNPGRELQMIQLHVTTGTLLTKALLPAMIRRRAGKILNVGSAGSLMPRPRDAVYGATKAYVLSFSEALAAELEGTGVTVTALLPGAIRTAVAARAGGADSIPFTHGVMDARRVAQIGYRALMQGRRRVVAGWHNRLSLAAAAWMPRPFRERIPLMARQLCNNCNSFGCHLLTARPPARDRSLPERNQTY